MLFNSNIRAIKVSYETEEQNPRRALYLYKTVDKSIQVGDYVVVPTETRHKMTVCKVEEVDVELDLNCTTQISWIVDKVNVHQFNKIVDEEKEFVKEMRTAQALQKQNELKESMKSMYEKAGLSPKVPLLGFSSEETSNNTK